MSEDDIDYEEYQPWTPAYENGTVCVVLEDEEEILMPGSIVKILRADTDVYSFGPDGIYDVEELFVLPGPKYGMWPHPQPRFFQGELQPVKDAFCDTVTKEDGNERT